MEGRPPMSPLAARLLPLVREAMAGDASGHDLAHILRVRHLALQIAAAEGADPEAEVKVEAGAEGRATPSAQPFPPPQPWRTPSLRIEAVELIALLHDVESRTGRDGHGTRGSQTAAAWLSEADAAPNLIESVALAIATLSWGSGQTPPTLEGRIVQDADRLDAIGAVGIARAFAYGGAHGRSPGLPAPDLDPAEPRKTVEHFSEKLLKLRATLHTATARRLAAGRHAFLVEFLRRLHEESQGRE